MSLRSGIRHAEVIGTDRLYGFRLSDFALWSASALFIVAAMGTGLLLVTIWREPPSVPGAPPPAIMIELAEIALAPQVEDIAVEDGERVLTPEPASAVAPARAADSNPPVEEPDELAPDPPETDAEPVEDPETSQAEDTIEEPEPIAEEAPAEPNSPAEAEAEPIEPTPPDPEAVEQVVPDLSDTEVPEEPIALPANFAMPTPAPQDLDTARRQAIALRERQRQQAQQQAASQQTAPRSVEAQPDRAMAAPEQTSTIRHAPNISPEQWSDRLIAHISRSTRYPNDARNRREEGRPLVEFAIDRAGRVLDVRIVQSSGYASLDQAARDTILRASPLPAPPQSIPGDRITRAAPINFFLR